MTWIRTIDPDDADERLRAIYKQAVDPQSGQLDNIVRAHSLHPAGLSGHLALYGAVMRSTPSFPKVEREMIALVVSQINGCHY
jgi:alkylhydroperoxidase family enzyme